MTFIFQNGFISLFLALCIISTITSTTRTTHAFSLSPPPVLGLGAVFFRPKGLVVRPTLGEDSDLTRAGQFFTDAFWTGKVGGGAKELSSTQARTLTKQQTFEFRKRYGQKLGSLANPSDRESELFLCLNGKDEIMGCCGIEIDSITSPSGRSIAGYINGKNVRAPLMSNVAVGRKFRRKGIAEELANAAEEVARKRWGYNECFLYVEKRNKPAIKLYRKLGYRAVWEDDEGRTLVPTEGGAVQNSSTVIVCMKKRLDRGIFARLLPF